MLYGYFLNLNFNIPKGVNSFLILLLLTLETQIASARNVLHGLIPALGTTLKLPFPVTPADNCGHDLKCPIQAGETVAYNVTLAYRAQDVPISVRLRFIHHDVCFEMFFVSYVLLIQLITSMRRLILVTPLFDYLNAHCRHVLSYQLITVR